MPPLSLSPHLELTHQLDTLTLKSSKVNNMCLIKNLLAKRSTRDLCNLALSPYPPNIFPFKPESEGETTYESEWDFSPTRESKSEPKRGSKSKCESVRVLPPRLLSLPLRFLPIPSINLCPPSARTLLPHLPRSLHSQRTLRWSAQDILDLAIAMEGAGADVVVSVEGGCEA